MRLQYAKRRVLRTGVAVLAIGASLCMQFSSQARSVTQIQQERDEIEDEIEDLDSDLSEIVSSIAELEVEIASKEEEIEETRELLQEAEAAVDQQYADMKKRIQFMYENGNDNVFDILLESGSIADFLTRLDYVSSVHTYDRNLLDNYENTVNEVAAIEQGLEEEQQALSATQEELSDQEAALSAAISEKQDELDATEEELSEAIEAAQAAARAQAEAEARAAAEAAAASTATEARTSVTSSDNVNGDLNPSGTTGVSGEAIVAYANQFVGCAYTWGGTDPVNGGADCSGFIYYVLKNFGINYGRLTSYGYRSIGQEVSYDYMQPGDIVCYAGHVAIYAGDGRIVEAQSTSAGITNTRSVNCHPIITIRRVV